MDKANIKQIYNINIYQSTEVEDNQIFTIDEVVRESLSEDLRVKMQYSRPSALWRRAIQAGRGSGCAKALMG